VAAAGDGGATWRGGEKPAGVGRAAGGRVVEPGRAGRAARGNWQRRRSPKRKGRERKTMGTCSQFFKSSRVSL
jgi:hypothetical protein